VRIQRSTPGAQTMGIYNSREKSIDYIYIYIYICIHIHIRIHRYTHMHRPCMGHRPGPAITIWGAPGCLQDLAHGLWVSVWAYSSLVW